MENNVDATRDPKSSHQESGDVRVTPFPELQSAKTAMFNGGNPERYIAMCDFDEELKVLLNKLQHFDPSIPSLGSYQLRHFMIGSSSLPEQVDLPNGELRRYILATSLKEQQQIGEGILENYRTQLALLKAQQPE